MKKLREELTKSISKVFSSNDVQIFDIDTNKSLVFYRCGEKYIIHTFYKIENEKYGFDNGSYLDNFSNALICYLERKNELGELWYKKFIEEQAEILKKKSEVIFSYGEYIYYIFESYGEDGYMVNVYESFSDLEDSNEFDGGLCTGSAENAIEFMLGA